MKAVRVAAAALVIAALAPACRGRGASGGGDGGRTPQQLVADGAYDEAIARLGAAADPESLYLLGRAWAGKARTAPLPTAAQGTAGEALLKPEELQAVSAFERVIAARPDHAGAQLALAELLAPHALVAARAGRPVPAAVPAAAGSSAADVTPERVLRCYGAAVQADPGGVEAVEALIRFATAAGRLGDADGAYQELLRRRREDPALLVRYGDFLAGPRRQPEAALSQYAQALMWRSDDEATRLKMADIQLQSAASHLAQREYALAEAGLADARRTGVTAGSAQEAKLHEIEEALREVRGR